MQKIEDLNNDTDVSGILVQLPLPPQINKEKIINAVSPKKDVDGFHPINVGNLSSGYHALVPCTPLGCLYLIKKVEKNLSGKHAVIIGRSNLNGKPMAIGLPFKFDLPIITACFPDKFFSTFFIKYKHPKGVQGTKA